MSSEVENKPKTLENASGGYRNWTKVNRVQYKPGQWSKNKPPLTHFDESSNSKRLATLPNEDDVHQQESKGLEKELREEKTTPSEQVIEPTEDSKISGLRRTFVHKRGAYRYVSKLAKSNPEETTTETLSNGPTVEDDEPSPPKSENAVDFKDAANTLEISNRKLEQKLKQKNHSQSTCKKEWKNKEGSCPMQLKRSNN